MSQTKIIILPAHNCRRSRKIIDYLEGEEIPFTRIELESVEGRALAAKHQMRASPGILVNGVSVNPMDLLIQSECRVDDGSARRVLGDRPSAVGSR